MVVQTYIYKKKTVKSVSTGLEILLEKMCLPTGNAHVFFFALRNHFQSKYALPLSHRRPSQQSKTQLSYLRKSIPANFIFVPETNKKQLMNNLITVNIIFNA